jgi:hypothetical protein
MSTNWRNSKEYQDVQISSALELLGNSILRVKVAQRKEAEFHYVSIP